MKDLSLTMLLVAVALGAAAGNARASGSNTATVGAAAARGLPPARRVQGGDIAVTIAGGGSQGVYLAGFTYMLAETIKRHGLANRLRLLTGASAGSINALTTALTVCGPPNPDPTKDLGWRTWMGINYDNLFVPEAVTAISLLSREPMIAAAEHSKRAWTAGLDATCDVVIGVTATRVEPEQIRVHGNFHVPRQEEKFLLRIRGRGRGRPPLVENYADPYASMPQPLLPFAPESDGELALTDNFDAIRDLLFASSAVPFAFAPVRIPHCLTDPDAAPGTKPGTGCSDPRRRDFFVDGGVFDNNPLRMAYRVSTDHLRQNPDGSTTWRALDTPAEEDKRSAARVEYLYIDPSRQAYPPMTDEVKILSRLQFLPLAARMAIDFVDAARSKELQTLVEESRDLSGRMRLTDGQYPKASSHLGGFSGFFDREFRRFDFYLGMYDAYRDLRRRRDAATEGLGLAPYVGDVEAPEAWQPFICLLATFEPDRVEQRHACDGDAMRDFRILLQVALDRVYSHCRQFEPEMLERIDANRHCLAAAGGEPRETIAGVRALDTGEVLKTAEETHLGHTLRLLSAYGFEFADLGLTLDEAKFGTVKMRRKLLKMLKAIADKQDVTSRTLMLTVGRTAINQLAYEPPRHWAYFVIGTGIETGASLLPFDWNYSWARLNVAVQAKGLETLLTQGSNVYGVTFAAGPELELLPITTPYVQPILGARAGWQITNRDDLDAKPCDAVAAKQDARNCNQLVVQSYFALGVVERVRIQATAEFFPLRQGFDDRFFDLVFGVGIHSF